MSKVVTEEYYRDFAVDRGRGTEYVRWTAWEADYPNRRGYGKTEEEAKNNLASFCPVVPEPPWTEEWPTEPGRYWFWGQVSRSWTGKYKPDYFLVKVRRCANGMMYVTDGCFVYEAEGAKGVWCPAILPDPPPSVGGK